MSLDLLTLHLYRIEPGVFDTAKVGCEIFVAFIGKVRSYIAKNVFKFLVGSDYEEVCKNRQEKDVSEIWYNLCAVEDTR